MEVSDLRYHHVDPNYQELNFLTHGGEDLPSPLEIPMTNSPSPPTPSGDLSIQAAANLTPCCVRTLRKAIARGRLRAYRIGNQIFIKQADFEAYLQDRKIPVAPDELAQKPLNQSDLQFDPFHPHPSHSDPTQGELQ